MTAGKDRHFNLMKPVDCIEQIISNEPSGWDEADTMSFQFYDAEVNGTEYASVTIAFNYGKVECKNEAGDILAQYAIKVTLEPITS